MAKLSVADLHAEHAALKNKFAALDPTDVHNAVVDLVRSTEVLGTLDRLTPLYEVMEEGDPLRQHIGNWIQVVKAVSMLAQKDS